MYLPKIELKRIENDVCDYCGVGFIEGRKVALYSLSLPWTYIGSRKYCLACEDKFFRELENEDYKKWQQQ